MNVVESRRSRLLIVRAERGEELVSSLARAADEAEAKAGWIEGVGVLEAVELACVDPLRGRVTRRIEAPVTIVSLTGSVAAEEGSTSVRLSATLVREGELGLETFGGEIVSARVIGLDLLVTVFDDVSLVRQTDDRTGVPVLYASSRGATSALKSVVTEAPRAQTPAPAVAAAPSPAPQPAAPPPTPPAATQYAAQESQHQPLARPVTKPREEFESYPETGDLVSHFHFGECEVISSDGERIRLRQEKDGRVREVSLTMLKIENHTIDPATGKRHFRLARKH